MIGFKEILQVLIYSHLYFALKKIGCDPSLDI